jgi:O-antigen/teichoic acid export membrane protein
VPNRNTADGETRPVLTDRQEQLLRRMGILAWLNVAVGVVGLAFMIADLNAVAWIALALVIAGLAATILMGRSLTRTGPPFEGARWWWPWASGRRR